MIEKEIVNRGRAFRLRHREESIDVLQSAELIQRANASQVFCLSNDGRRRERKRDRDDSGNMHGN